MSTKKQNKIKSNKKPARTQRQVSNGFVPRRVPTGMTQLGVADDGTIVYNGTPQVLQQYWPDLYNRQPGAPGYVFTGKDGVYTPVGQSNHAYDEIVNAHPVRVQKEAIGPEITVIGHNNNVQEPELSTYNEGPASNPYNANDPFLQERLRQQFWNNGGRDIWLKQADARAKALTPTLGTFAKLAWKPIETVMPSNLLGTLFKQVRNPSLSRLSSDLLGSGFGGGNLGFTEISDATANWAQNNPEANGIINTFGDVGAGLLTAPTRALINQGFRAVTPSTYVTSGLTNAGRAIGGRTGNFLVSNAGRAGTAADLAAFGIPAYNAWEEFAENPTIANGIIATGTTIPAAGPAFKTLRAAAPIVKATVPRTYTTSNGKVFGFNMGDYAVGLDARGVNAYGGLPPIRGGKVNTIRINGNRNVLTNDEVNSLVNGSGLKVNGNTIKNVSVDYTNGIVRGKFGGKDVEFYIGEEPVFNEEKGVIITNPQGRYDLGSDLKKAYEIKLGPEVEGNSTVLINGNRYTVTDPSIQDMEVRFIDGDNLSYQGPLRNVITRMGIQPRATVTTPAQEVMPVNTPELRPAEESSLSLEQPVAEGATPEEIVAVQNTASGTPEVKPVETPTESVTAEQPVTQPKPRRPRKVTPKAEKITIDDIAYTAKRKVNQGRVKYELTDENGDTFTIPEWYYNKYANSGHKIQARIKDRKLTNNLETISGDETEMIDQVMYKGKPYDVIRNRDFTSTLHNPDTNESITMTDIQVLDEISKGNLKNPTYTEPMKAKTWKAFDNRYDEIWRGANQNMPTRMNVADRKRITLRDRYNTRLQKNSWQRIPNPVKVWSSLGIGTPAVIAAITGLSGRNSGTSNVGPDGYDTTKYVVDPVTLDTLLKSVADSMRIKNKEHVKNMNNDVDTLKRVENTTTQSDQESSMGNAGSLNLNTQPTVVPTGDADTIPVDENRYMLRSNPGVMYHY